VLDDDTKALLEAGSSTIVGLVTTTGEPFATRGWGSVVVSDEPVRMRTLVGAGPLIAAGYDLGEPEPFAIAVTGADVQTLQSVQVKGRVVAVEPVTDDDLELSARFCDDFFEKVERVDGVGRHLMSRLVPSDLWACTVEVAEVYDQTPGPAAGRSIGA
jgi:hypothetical protein